MATYQFRSHAVRADGTVSKSNLNSRPYVSAAEVLADPTLNDNDRRRVHDFVNDQWYIVANGALTTIDRPQEA